MRRVPVEVLQAGGEALLMAHGASQETARVVLDVLVTAEARGHGSHGLGRLGRIVAGIKAGFQDPRVRPDLVERGRSCLLADGRAGLGPFTAATIMAAVIERAQSVGLCLASAHHIHHFGIGGYFTDMAARAGLVGLVLCNTQPAATMFGGRGRVLGTNPISFSCPSGQAFPITLDMATTAVARGKILECARLGTTLPESVAAAPDGRMTTDPGQGLAGALLPLGGLFGFKGSGLALMVDILAGALAGAATGTRVAGTLDVDVQCTAGFFFLAVDPEFFCGRQAFLDEVRRLVRDVRDAGPEVLLPGERGHRREARARQEGLPLERGCLDTLNELAVAAGLDPIAV